MVRAMSVMMAEANNSWRMLLEVSPWKCSTSSTIFNFIAFIIQGNEVLCGELSCVKKIAQQHRLCAIRMAEPDDSEHKRLVLFSFWH